jgi:hypothetical protein
MLLGDRQAMGVFGQTPQALAFPGCENHRPSLTRVAHTS